MRIDEERLPEGWDQGVVVERDGAGAIRRVAGGSAVLEVDGDRLVLRDTQEIPDADPEVALMALQSVISKARGPGCSFCGKPHAEVEKLITGPNVAICDECIGACAEILAADVE